MSNEDKKVENLLKEVQLYFGKNEKIYILKCEMCGKFDPVLSFVIDNIWNF